MLLSLFGNLLARPFQQLFPAFVHDALNGDARDLSYVMTAAGHRRTDRRVRHCLTGHDPRRAAGVRQLRRGDGRVPGAVRIQHALLPAVILAFCVAAASQMFITMASALYHTHTPDIARPSDGAVDGGRAGRHVDWARW